MAPKTPPPAAPAPPAAPNPTQGESQGPPGHSAETIPHNSNEEPRPAESEEDIPSDDSRAG
jgi:hypothetical protein